MKGHELRIAKRDAYCRSCDKRLKKDKDWMVTMYSFRNQGMHVHLCLRCVENMGALVTEHKKLTDINSDEV